MNDEQVIEQRLAQAPQELKDFIAAEGWGQALTTIAHKNNFSSDQQTSLENEILFILLDMALMSDLATNLAESLAIAPPLAEAIARELDETVFSQVKQFLPTQEESQNTTTQETTAGLPAIEPGETAHDTTPEEKVFMATPPVADTPSATATAPEPPHPAAPAYPAGQDPYREPLD